MTKKCLCKYQKPNVCNTPATHRRWIVGMHYNIYALNYCDEHVKDVENMTYETRDEALAFAIARHLS